MQPNVAVLIPCFNEEPTVASVVADFRRQLPNARIYVFDNGSQDGTVREAVRAGAIVKHVSLRGKGHVVQAMFRDVEADVYLMVDGDATYPAEKAHELITPVADGQADMVVGSRLHGNSRSRFRFSNRTGNRMFRAAVNALFRSNLTDLLSGYRAFSRDFVRSIRLRTVGFEIETELTLRALADRRRILEVPVDLGERPDGSFSKICKIRDGLKILCTIWRMHRGTAPSEWTSNDPCSLRSC
jgi:glycosyltransferase involved in cell wall biosynthesis